MQTLGMGYGNDIKRETWTTEKLWHAKRSFRSAQQPSQGVNHSGCRVWAGGYALVPVSWHGCHMNLYFDPREAAIYHQHCKSCRISYPISECLTALGTCMKSDETSCAIVHGQLRNSADSFMFPSGQRDAHPWLLSCLQGKWAVSLVNSFVPFKSVQLSSGQVVRIFLVMSGHQQSKAFPTFVALLLHLTLVTSSEIQAGTAPGQAVDGTNVQQLQYAQKQL